MRPWRSRRPTSSVRGLREPAVHRREERGIDGKERRADLPDRDEVVEQAGRLPRRPACGRRDPGSRGGRRRRRAPRCSRACTGTSIGGSAVTAIRRRPGGAPGSSANGRSGGGAHQGSPGSYPVRTSSRAAASATEREIGPEVESPSSDGKGEVETRPRDGLRPKTPQQEAGILIEPPPSVPCASGISPAASAAAAPPLDPPGVSSGFQGFRVAPFSSDSVNATVPNSGVFVLPRITNPASRSRRTTAVSKSGTLSANARLEYVVRMPAVAVRSLIAIGTPRNGARPPSVRRPRFGERFLAPDGDERIQLGIDPRDPLEVELGELDGGDRLGPDEPRLLDAGRNASSIERRRYTLNGEGRNRTGDTTVFSRVLDRLSYLAAATDWRVPMAEGRP